MPTTEQYPPESLAKASEKHGWLKTILIVFLLVLCIDEIIYISLHKNTIPSTKQQPTQIIQATPQTDQTQNWNIYNSPEGKFSIKYPNNYTLTDNSASSSSIQFLSYVIPSLSTNFRLTIQYKAAPGNPSLQQLISQNSPCTQVTSQNGEPSIINGQQTAQIYVDTPCGKYITTIIYTINNNIFYTITIETNAHFADIKPYADALLATLHFN